MATDSAMKQTNTYTNNKPTSNKLSNSSSVLKKSGRVSLLKLERQDSYPIFAVSYPKKVGNQNSATLKETQQFLKIEEAERCFKVFAQFFNQKG